MNEKININMTAEPSVTPPIDEIWQEVLKKADKSAVDTAVSTLTDTVSQKASAEGVSTQIDAQMKSNKAQIKSEIQVDLNAHISEADTNIALNSNKITDVSGDLTEFKKHRHDDLYLLLEEKQEIIDDVTKKLLGDAPVEALDTLTEISEKFKEGGEVVQQVLDAVGDVDKKADTNTAAIAALPVPDDLTNLDKDIIFKATKVDLDWNLSSNTFAKSQKDYMTINRENETNVKAPPGPSKTSVTLKKTFLWGSEVTPYGLFMFVMDNTLSGETLLVPEVDDVVTIQMDFPPTTAAPVIIPTVEFKLTSVIESSTVISEKSIPPFEATNGKIYLIKGDITKQTPGSYDEYDYDHWFPIPACTKIVDLPNMRDPKEGRPGFMYERCVPIKFVGRHKTITSHKIKNVSDPSLPTDVATKGYVDKSGQIKFIEVIHSAFGKSLNYIADDAQKNNIIDTTCGKSMTLMTEETQIEENCSNISVINSESSNYNSSSDIFASNSNGLSISDSSYVISSGCPSGIVQNSSRAALFGGNNNRITYANYGAVISGNTNTVTQSNQSTIMGGYNNTISYYNSTSNKSNNSSIISSNNCTINGGQNSIIIGSMNTVYRNSNYSLSVGQNNSLTTLNNSIVIGSRCTIENANNSIIVGSYLNTNNALNVALFGTYNDTNNVNNYSLLIGGGKDERSRQNVFGVTKGGNLFIPSGAQDGYVLTTDSMGNASWKKGGAEDPYAFTQSIQRGANNISSDTYNLNDRQSYQVLTNVSAFSLSFVQPKFNNQTGNIKITNSSASTSCTFTPIAAPGASLTFNFLNKEAIVVEANTTIIISWWYDGRNIFFTHGTNYGPVA